MFSIQRADRCPSDMPQFDWKTVVRQGRIGEGGYAEVAKYNSTEHGIVAVKSLHGRCSTYRKGFLKEATILNSCSHPNIAKFLAYSSSGTDAIMLEFVGFDFSVVFHDIDITCHSLEDLLLRLDEYEFQECKHLHDHIADGMIKGLHYLHGKDIAHRDLKPSNVLISNQHYAYGSPDEMVDAWRSNPIAVKFTDFGESRSRLIHTNTLAGTRTDDLYRGSTPFMAPEILQRVHSGTAIAKVTVDDLKQMDIWSLCMVFFIMLNPDQHLPYEEDLLQLGLKSKELIEKCMVRMWSKDKLPTFTKKYEESRRGEWCSVLQLYQMTAKINPSSRPRIGDLHMHRNLGDGSDLGEMSKSGGKRSDLKERSKSDGKESVLGETSKGDGKESVLGETSKSDGKESVLGETSKSDGKESVLGETSKGDGKESDMRERSKSDGKESDLGETSKGDGKESDVGTTSKSDGKESEVSKRSKSDGKESDVGTTSKSDRKESDLGETSKGDGKESDMRERSKSDGKESDVRERSKSDGKESDVRERSKSDGKESDVRERSKSDGKESDVGTTSKSDGKESDMRERSKSDGKESDVGEMSKNMDGGSGISTADVHSTFDLITFLPLRCSQNTAMEQYDLSVSTFLESEGNDIPDFDLYTEFKLPDHDGTNACAFLDIMIANEYMHKSEQNQQTLFNIAEKTIEEFPAELNDLRDKERGYEPLDALTLLRELDLVDESVELDLEVSPRSWKDSNDEFANLWKTSQFQRYDIFILVSEPYACLSLSNCDEVLFLDTHPVSELNGGNANGLLLTAPNSDDGRKQLAAWLHRRFGKHAKAPYDKFEVQRMWIATDAQRHSSYQSKEVSGSDEDGQSSEDSGSDTDGASDLSVGPSALTKLRDMLKYSNWDQCAEETAIPYDVDGLRKFSIPCSEENMMQVTKDGRPWDYWVSSTRKGFKGKRRTARCKGTPICNNATCKIDGDFNRGQFEKAGSLVICKICKKEADYPACPARKVWEYSKSNGKVTVMYTGNHTCVAKYKSPSNKELQRELRASSFTTASEFVVHKMDQLITSTTEVPWDDVDKVSKAFVNVKRINNAKAALSATSLGSSFDAVSAYKKRTDEKDTYLVYKMNNRNMNQDPTYVFKTSESAAKIGINMDITGTSRLRSAYAFMDTKHGRTAGLKTVTLWVYDPLLQRVLSLAIMDVDGETTENLVLFWRLWNEVLQKVADKEDYRFNPVGWVVDEGAANWKSIEEVFGEEGIKRTYSCEWHYLQSVKKQAAKTDDPKEFKALCEEALRACTKEGYDSAMKKVRSIGAKHNMETWIKWWDDRKHHVFRAFKPFSVPNTNYAEIGHAKLTRVTGNNLTLLKACRFDVIFAIRQANEIASTSRGEVGLGRGPSQQQLQAKSRKRQMNKARSYTEELDGIDLDGASDNAPPKKKGKKKRKGKKSSRPASAKSSRPVSATTSRPVSATSSRPASAKSKLVSAKERHNLPPLTAKQLQDRKNQPILLTRRQGIIKICYGCNSELEASKEPPHDLILKKTGV